MESIINDIKNLIQIIIETDPAIYRVVIFDYYGIELYTWSKQFDRQRKDSIGPMINQILKFSDKFLGFLKNDYRDPFILKWFFENAIIIAGNTPFGFIGIYSEKDINLGILERRIKGFLEKYREIMKPIYD